MPVTKEQLLERMAKARKTPRKPKPETVHLVRGAPAVRSWSKYQKPDYDWTLCGILRVFHGRPTKALITENPKDVNCEFCHQLMA